MTYKEILTPQSALTCREALARKEIRTYIEKRVVTQKSALVTCNLFTRLGLMFYLVNQFLLPDGVCGFDGIRSMYVCGLMGGGYFTARQRAFMRHTVNIWTKCQPSTVISLSLIHVRQSGFRRLINSAVRGGASRSCLIRFQLRQI